MKHPTLYQYSDDSELWSNELLMRVLFDVRLLSWLIACLSTL